MEEIKYARVYRLGSGEVVIDTPTLSYQKIYETTQTDRCPHPWRFRSDVIIGPIENPIEVIPGNPDKEEYESLEILSYGDLLNVVGAENVVEAGSMQFYYDGNNDLKCDLSWENNLMDRDIILVRHAKRLNSFVDDELAESTPNMVQISRWQQEIKKLSEKTEKDAWEIALDSLQYADIAKLTIRKKLQVKLGIPVNVVPTEGDTEVVLAWDEVADTDSYKIYWGTETGVYTNDDTSATNSYTITELTNDTPYFMAVVAIKDEVESRKSDEKEATPVAA